MACALPRRAKVSVRDRLRLPDSLRAFAQGSYKVSLRWRSGCPCGHHYKCCFAAKPYNRASPDGKQANHPGGISLAPKARFYGFPAAGGSIYSSPRSGDTKTLGPKGPVNLKNPRAEGPLTFPSEPSGPAPFGANAPPLPRWEACHWIFGSLCSPTNPVPLPPRKAGGQLDSRGGAAKRPLFQNPLAIEGKIIYHNNDILLFRHLRDRDKGDFGSMKARGLLFGVAVAFGVWNIINSGVNTRSVAILAMIIVCLVINVYNYRQKQQQREAAEAAVREKEEVRQLRAEARRRQSRKNRKHRK